MRNSLSDGIFRELEDLRKDAERYRYLKNTQHNDCRDWDAEEDSMCRVGVIDRTFVCTEYGGAEAISPDQFDAYIDSAMLLFPQVDDLYNVGLID